MPDPPVDPPVDPPQPPADPPQPPTAPPAAPPEPRASGLKDQVKAILGELAASGELFGEGGGQGSGVDVEAAISRVLERRQAEGEARTRQEGLEKTIQELRDKLPKPKRWFQPWTPWSE